MKNPIVHVTDHAVLRYLERAHGVDVEGLRKRIGRTVDNGVNLGANGVKFCGLSYVLAGRTVVTIAKVDRRKLGQRRRK